MFVARLAACPPDVEAAVLPAPDAAAGEPRTYTGRTRAFETADMLAKLTGWPVIDETKGGGNVSGR